MINKAYKKHFLIIMAICLIFVLIGTFYDYNITNYLYNPASAFGVFFEAFGFFPIYVCIPIFGATLMVSKKDNMLPFFLGVLTLIGFCTVYSYIGFFKLYNRGFIIKINTYLVGIIGGMLAGGIFVLIRKLKTSSLLKIKAICAFGFMYLICETGVILVLKFIFGRDRYEDIILANGKYAFANWYQPEFFSQGSSFPSGHTAAAMGIILLLLIPFLFKTMANKKTIMVIISYGYVFLMGLSRLIMGRHFISDVAFSILLMTFIFMALTPYFEKVYKKYFV